MIPETLIEVMKDEGIVAIVTNGSDFPHVVNTWNSYLSLSDDGSILIPAGGMNITESNLEKDERVLVTIGSRNIQGLRYKGTGFLIEGTAKFEKQGVCYDLVKAKYEWIRAALVIKPDKITQTL